MIKHDTVDSLIDNFKKSSYYNSSFTDTYTCMFIIKLYPTILFDIIESKSNVPSKYDLHMISALTTILNKKLNIPYTKDMQIMLQIYRDRKD